MSTIESETVVPPQTTQKREWLPSQVGEPTWELALTFPRQGTWSKTAYLQLDVGQLVEFKDGVLEFLPLPTQLHQVIAAYLFKLLSTFVLARRLGTVFHPPMPMVTISNHLREPDVVYIPRERMSAASSSVEGALLVMEVISPGIANRHRDEVEKRKEYAESGIPEFWLVDPEFELIHVLSLNEGGAYDVDGTYKRGAVAVSKVLDGFNVDINATFDEFAKQAAGPR